MKNTTTLQRAILSRDKLAGTGDRLDTAEAGVVQPLHLNLETPIDARKWLDEHPRVRFISLVFADAAGGIHHCTFNASYVTANRLKAGFAFDASSIPLMERIDNSDLVMIPDMSTCYLDPFASYPTLHIVCSIAHPTAEPYAKCPRSILKKAIDTMLADEIADNFVVGPELEFFVFNSMRFSVQPHHMEFELDGDEGYWNFSSKSHQNLGHRANLKQGYMTSCPTDRLADLRSEVLLVTEQLGIKTEKHHHEVATCQMEVNIEGSSALNMADNVQTIKYIVKNCAKKKGMTATFMPKPLANDNGSGMHFNLSLWKDNVNLFYDPNSEFHNLSPLAMKFMSGILKHCRSLLALCCPTSNSYRRLVPQFEAPIHVTYSAGNRSTGIRVPTFTNERTTRLEFRMPDAACCPYTAFAAVLMAGIDGVRNDYPLPPRGEGDLFDELNPISSSVNKAPETLKEAIECLAEDHDYLTANGVFTKSFIHSFIKAKKAEIASLAPCPHPQEFLLYYGC